MNALTVAGFDPSGGAGIISDIKTFHALNVYGKAVITALTAQNVRKVYDILPVETEFIGKQIDAVLEVDKPSYTKTGMLYSPEIIEIVTGKIMEYNLEVVVDPVITAGSGDILAAEGYVAALKKKLLPLAFLTTPNISEAQSISGVTIENEEDAIKAAIKIGKHCNVVVTGGHLNGNDLYYDGNLVVYEGELIESANTHGSGCTYSAAITAYLVKGYSLKVAVEKAGIFTKKSIKHGVRGTLNQFW